jgi:hypothetical protein
MIPDIHKTVIVTGASQGIGAGLVKAFRDRRYNVVATSRSITKTGGFKASDKLELVDGSTADLSTATRNPRAAQSPPKPPPVITTRGSLFTQELPHLWSWIGVNSGSFVSVSTTITASILAGSVLLAFSSTLCRSPGISAKFCPAL